VTLGSLQFLYSITNPTLKSGIFVIVPWFFRKKHLNVLRLFIPAHTPILKFFINWVKLIRKKTN